MGEAEPSGIGDTVLKLILSRKGFDSAAGGCPSPILPDGRLLSLPIPDRHSAIRYGDIDFGDDYGALISQLTRGRLNRGSRAHLDPDLEASHLPRAPGWRPVLGQSGAAQGHLRKQQVGCGDLFLFFGLFRPVETHQRRWRFIPGAPPRHIIWGWMQVAEVLSVDGSARGEPWLAYHPHLQMPEDPNNTLYCASDCLSAAVASDLPGSGTFRHCRSSLQLTAADSPNPSRWLLPPWFSPDGRPPLTYHNQLKRWQPHDQGCILQCAARGQEFILDTAYYPQALAWIDGLIRHEVAGCQGAAFQA